MYYKSTKAPIITEGRLNYDNLTRRNNRIRLKNRLIDEFEGLVRAKEVRYRTELYKTYEELNERIKIIIEQKQAMPILLFFKKESDYAQQ